MTFWKWSQTAASNGTADSTCPFPEGMGGAALNDGARGMMAAAAKYRDDMAGAIVTGGAVNAYTVSSYQNFDSLAHLNGQAIAFTPHITNTAAVLLSVDGLGGKPLRPAPGVELQSGVLIQGTPYLATYNNSDAVFYLRGVGTAPGVPLGSSFDYWGTSAPSTFFALSFGQAISRATYATLFSLCGTTYGVGDGSTTFNIPDLRGRVIAGQDNMGGAAAGRIGAVVTDSGTITGTTLGSAGGSPTHALSTAEMPAHSHGITDPGHTHTFLDPSNNPKTPHVKTQAGGVADFTTSGGTEQTDIHLTTNTTGITVNNAGSGTAHAILQPTIIANKLLRII